MSAAFGRLQIQSTIIFPIWIRTKRGAYHLRTAGNNKNNFFKSVLAASIFATHLFEMRLFTMCLLTMRLFATRLFATCLLCLFVTHIFASRLFATRVFATRLFLFVLSNSGTRSATSSTRRRRSSPSPRRGRRRSGTGLRTTTMLIYTVYILAQTNRELFSLPELWCLLRIQYAYLGLNIFRGTFFFLQSAF